MVLNGLGVWKGVEYAPCWGVVLMWTCAWEFRAEHSWEVVQAIQVDWGEMILELTSVFPSILSHVTVKCVLDLGSCLPAYSLTCQRPSLALWNNCLIILSICTLPLSSVHLLRIRGVVLCAARSVKRTWQWSRMTGGLWLVQTFLFPFGGRHWFHGHWQSSRLAIQDPPK